MAYNLKKVYENSVDQANKAIELSNEMDNEVTKQMFTITTFMLVFISSFIYLLKDRLSLPVEMLIFSVNIKYLLIITMTSGILSLLLGLWALSVAASFFLKKSITYQRRAVVTQKYVTDNKTIASDVLPFEYDIEKGSEASSLEICLTWLNRIFFVISIMLGMFIIIYLILHLF